MQWFRNAVNRDDLMPDHLSELLFTSLDHIYDFHCAFLKEIETRLHMWSVMRRRCTRQTLLLCCVVLPVFVRFREGKSNAHLNGDYQRIGDIVLNGMRVLQVRVDVHHVV